MRRCFGRSSEAHSRTGGKRSSTVFRSHSTWIGKRLDGRSRSVISLRSFAVNDSTSAISRDWPTRWPKDSFKGVWTWLLAGFVAFLFVAAFVAGLRTGRVPAVTPIEFDVLILLQFALEGALVVLLLAAL